MSKIGQNPLSTKPYWRRINRIRNKKEPKDIPSLIINDTLIELNTDKAKAFGNRLNSIFNNSELDEVNFNLNHKKFVNNFINKKEYIDKNSDTSFDEITSYELDNANKKIKNKVSIDELGISTLKHLPANIKINILHLFNRCIQTNYIPGIWKNSLIRMIPKKGDKHNIKNYRPISSTPCVMKLFEKIIQERLRKILDSKNIIIKQQSGFRANRQTKDNLVFMTQKISEKLIKSQKACVILFDIQDAFDKVWHNGLIYKLWKLKIPIYLLQWIITFLENRQFRVVVDGSFSESYKISCGVPQGAVLSPILFSIYINDIPLNEKKQDSYSLLFADDLMNMKMFSKINVSIESQLNKYLKLLETWLNTWQLKRHQTNLATQSFRDIIKQVIKVKKVFNEKNLIYFYTTQRYQTKTAHYFLV